MMDCVGQPRCTGFGLSFEFLHETEKTKPESHVQAFNPVDHVNPVSVLCLRLTHNLYLF